MKEAIVEKHCYHCGGKKRAKIKALFQNDPAEEVYDLHDVPAGLTSAQQQMVIGRASMQHFICDKCG